MYMLMVYSYILFNISSKLIYTHVVGYITAFHSFTKHLALIFQCTPAVWFDLVMALGGHHGVGYLGLWVCVIGHRWTSIHQKNNRNKSNWVSMGFGCLICIFNLYLG